jgi:hypothetical protein
MSIKTADTARAAALDQEPVAGDRAYPLTADDPVFCRVHNLAYRLTTAIRPHAA